MVDFTNEERIYKSTIRTIIQNAVEQRYTLVWSSAKLIRITFVLMPLIMCVCKFTLKQCATE